MKRLLRAFLVAGLVSVLLMGLAYGCRSEQKVATGVPPASEPTARPAKPAWEVKWETAVGEAKKEAELMIYSVPSGDVLRALASTFGSKYGVKIDFLVGRADELQKRMEEERKVGLYLADIVLAGGPAVLIAMKPSGYVDSFDPVLVLPEVVDPKAWRGGIFPFTDKDRTHVRMIGTFLRYILRNTEIVKEGEIASYKNLLDPKWKGKMVLQDPTVTGTGANFITFLATEVWGYDQTIEFMRQLVKQEPAINRDRRIQVEWVSRGKYAIGIATHTETNAEFIKAGAPIAIVQAAEGGQLSTGAGGLAVVKNRPHPNAATVFVNWLLSKEGQTVFTKNFGHPSTRLDVTTEGIPPIFFPAAGDKVYADSEESILFQARMMQQAKEILAPLMK